MKILSQTGTVTISFVPVELILGLRHAQLRPGLPIDTARFQGDELPTTWHIGLFNGIITDKLVSCCSFFLNSHDDKRAWQLRGMATDEKYRGKGFGKEMLATVEKVICKDSGISFFWCNARESALEFYKKQGWVIQGERFNIPTAGPHYVMTKNLA